jgi:hypothetical protein
MLMFGWSMQPMRVVILGTAFLAAGFTGVAAAEETMVVVRREDARFVPLDPKYPDGMQVAVLRGDPAKGPSAALARVPKYTGAVHYHTYAYDLVVLEGRMKHWKSGEQEADVQPLGPGSYWHQPANQVHGDSCLTDVCLVFIKWEGKWESLPPDPPK